MKSKFMALALALVVGTGVLTGCVSKTANSQTAAQKTLVFGQAAEPVSLDPAYADDGESAKVIGNVFDTLVKYNEDKPVIEPNLATEWTISPDGKEYTFKLRQGIKFQDGTPFNADAVKFSIERQMDSATKDNMGYADFAFGVVDKVEKVDEYTVKIVLKNAYTPFLANLTMNLGAPIVSPTAVKKYGDAFKENPVGTGPFKFVSWEKGQTVTLERNNEYWGEKAKVDKVVFRVIKEASVRASELMTGGVDIIGGVDPNDIEKMKQNKVNIYTSVGDNVNYLGFNTSRAPFNDPKLREAVSRAINREELVKFLYQNYSSVANTQMPNVIAGYNDKVQPYAYDAEKAKELLKASGKENLEIKMITYSNARTYNPVNGQKLAEAVQNYLAKVGIKANIETYPWSDYKGKMKQGEGDIFFYGWVGDNGDPDNFLSLFDSKEKSMNMAKYSNSKVDELLAQAKQMPNGEERNKVYRDIQDILAVDAPWLPISYAQNIAAYSPKVKNFKLYRGALLLKEVDKE